MAALLLALLVHTVISGSAGSPPALAAGPSEARPASFDHEHAAWSAILTRYVVEGRVDYRGILERGQPALQDYLNTLESAASSEATWGRSERMAFWINAYNAYTVRLILDHYPLRSIRAIGFLPLAAFRSRFIPLGANRRLISLNTIENEMLRAQFRDARIHFTIVCASKSCPALRSEAYRASALDRQLQEAADAFLHDPSKNRWEPESGTLRLSSIFTWFRSDFERDGGTLNGFVQHYLTLPGANRIGTAPKLDFLPYDWALNGQ